ncbi:GUN4 domain-containing protein [Phormidium tenue FACHB-886]|nr:GUN4 domain-containing protein [Phormidium tenue FACHB-886]
MTLSTPSDLLKSDRGVDYKTLRDALRQQDWEIADRLTYLHFQQALKTPERSWISDRRLKRFPKNDLLTIDRLWVEQSRGRFGFSVQRRLYLECGGKLKGERDALVWDAFLDRVGWRVELPADEKQTWMKVGENLLVDWSLPRRLQHEDEICYSLDTPEGYFPCPLIKVDRKVAGGRYGHFMEHRSLYEHWAWQTEESYWWQWFLQWFDR